MEKARSKLFDFKQISGTPFKDYKKSVEGMVRAAAPGAPHAIRDLLTFIFLANGRTDKNCSEIFRKTIHNLNLLSIFDELNRKTKDIVKNSNVSTKNADSNSNSGTDKNTGNKNEQVKITESRANSLNASSNNSETAQSIVSTNRKRTK